MQYSYNTLNPSCLRSVCLEQSLTGFCSTLITVLGLVDFCEKFETNFVLPKDENSWFQHYARTDPSVESYYKLLFHPSSFSKLIFNKQTKPFDASFYFPPSPNPIFSMSMLTDSKGYITNGWRRTLNQALKHIVFSEKLMSYIKKSYIKNDTTHKKSKMVGVHIRGTDIDAHGSLGCTKDRIRKLHSMVREDEEVFLATDEEKVLQECKMVFGSRLHCLDTTVRSADKTPIHEAWRHGKSFNCEDNLISLLREIHILSSLDRLILSRSSVGLMSLIINPHIEFEPLDSISTNHDVFKYRDNISVQLNQRVEGNKLIFT